ncbi:MAG: ThuA domain-containing protein, partial [Armatimonadota bacterium]
MADPIRVTVWHEYRHEHDNPDVAAVYPDGIHEAIADFLRPEDDLQVRTATLDEPQHGLTDEVLENTDVLTWWGHGAHQEVKDEIVEKIHARILQGMGLIPLHSSHKSKIFMTLMGTTCQLKWREIGEKERLWVLSPGHPIVEGIGECIELPHTEMYGEHHDIPAPDEIIF